MNKDSRAPRPRTRPNSLTTVIDETAANTNPAAARINAGAISEAAVSVIDFREASFLPIICRLSI